MKSAPSLSPSASPSPAAINTVNTTAQPSPVLIDDPGLGRLQTWALPTDENSLWMLIEEIFQGYWQEILFGTCVPGAVWEVRAPNAPTRISLLDGYLTVDFGPWHFHLCIGEFSGVTPELAALRRTGRAELYRILNNEGKPKSWGVRLFTVAGDQQMTVFLPNPFLDAEGHLAASPDWSKLAAWDALREAFLDLPPDPFDRTASGLVCGG